MPKTNEGIRRLAHVAGAVGAIWTLKNFLATDSLFYNGILRDDWYWLVIWMAVAYAVFWGGFTAIALLITWVLDGFREGH